MVLGEEGGGVLLGLPGGIGQGGQHPPVLLGQFALDFPGQVTQLQNLALKLLVGVQQGGGGVEVLRLAQGVQTGFQVSEGAAGLYPDISLWQSGECVCGMAP